MHKSRRILLCMLVATVTWGTRSAAAVTIRVDYSLDAASSNFFGSGNPQGAAAGAQAKAAVDAAAAFYSNRLGDTLSAIQKPADFMGSSGATAKWNWRRNYINPSGGFENPELNKSIAANDYVVFVGARDLAPGKLGLGGPGWVDLLQKSTLGTFTAQETTQIDATTTQFFNAVETRGETSGFASWGGSLAVDNADIWHFNHTTAPPAGKFDFYSVVMHEFAHALGFGTSQAWIDELNGMTFNGPAAKAIYPTNGPVPLAPPDDEDFPGHWSAGIAKSTVYGGATSHDPLMVPSLPVAMRRQLTNLDAAALVDIGWEITLPQPVPGDYNRNGSVDAADYTVWRNTLGSTTDLRANGNNTGASANKIDQADYAFWKTSFGNTSGSGGGAVSVPVPATALLLLIVAALMRRRSHR